VESADDQGSWISIDQLARRIGVRLSDTIRERADQALTPKPEPARSSPSETNE
jgi:hypothetical protein